MRRIGFVVWSICAVSLAGCADSAAHNDPPLGLTHVSRALPSDSPLTTCTDPHPVSPRPVDTALAKDFAAQRVRTTFTLSGGTFTAAPPPPSAAPAIDANVAFCNLLAGFTAENVSVVDVARQSGLSFGLAVVTISDGVQHPDVGTSLGQKKAGVAPYHARLAWIALMAPEVESSCPAMLPSSARRSTGPAQPHLPPYQVLAVDANTGADGVVYSARTDKLCGFPGYRSATVSPAVESVSVPWALDSRGPGSQSATITYQPRSCDQPIDVTFVGTGKPAVWVGRDHPATVDVRLERMLTPCGPAAPVRILLRSATVTTDLPAHLVHAPVGADDTPDS